MKLYTIEPEGEQWRVKWGGENCGLFKTLEQARWSLRTLERVGEGEVYRHFRVLRPAPSGGVERRAEG